MFVKPNDWNSDDNNFHVFFESRGRGALFLYKYIEPDRILFLATQDQNKGPFFSSGTRTRWKAGEWTHLAGVWNETGVQLYVNGKPVSRIPSPAKLPTSLGSNFSIGDLFWHTPRTTSSAIDEVRIYGRALSEREIRSHANGVQDVKYSADDGNSYSVFVKVDPNQKRARIAIETDSIEASETIAVRPRVLRSSKITGAQYAFCGTKAQFSIAIDDEIEQSRTLELDFVDKYSGRLVLSQKAAIPLAEVIEAEEQERLHSETHTRPPESHLDRISPNGREYDYSGNSYPNSIVSWKHEILASPATISIKVGPDSFELDKSSRTITKKDDYVKLSDSYVSKKGTETAHAKVTVESKVFEDGVVSSVVAFEGKDGPLKNVTASISFAVKNDIAKFFLPSQKGFEKRENVLITDEGFSYESGWLPYIWIGNDDVGIFWAFETSEGWPSALEPDAIKINRKSESTELVVTIAENAGIPNAPFRFSFQATPARKLTNGWRELKLSPAANATHEVIWPRPESNSLAHYGYPEASNSKLFSERIDRMGNAGIKPVVYLGLTYVATTAPEWVSNEESWFMGGIDTESSDVRAFGGGFAQVSPRASTWRRFIIGKSKRFLTPLGIDSVYVDNVQPYGAYAPYANLGTIKRPGIKEYPLLAYRSLFESYRNMLDAIRIDSEPLIIAHTSNNVMPLLGEHIDATLDGEQFRGKVKADYYELIDLNLLRAEFSGRQFGVIPIFLPEFDRSHSELIAPTRGLMGMLLLHDILVWPIWCNLEEVNRVSSQLSKFGYEKSLYNPYYKGDLGIVSRNPHVLISSYSKNGEELFVVVNTHSKAEVVSLCVADDRDVYDFPVQKIVKADRNGCFSRSINGRDFVFLYSPSRL